MILRLALIAALALTGCGRALSPAERSFLSGLHGEQLDHRRVRLVKGAPVGSFTFRRKARPRVTCRERILPPVKEEIVTVSPAAVALFNRVYFTKDWFAPNYVRGYPERLHLVGAMLLAHEMTHIWQWQHRDRTGYHPLRAAAEHGTSDDPYLFELDGTPDFLSFGYEQQGAIMEEYVCCRALDPQAPRTRRLHRMLAAVMPVSDLPQSGRERAVLLPWDGAEIEGICSAPAG